MTNPTLNDLTCALASGVVRRAVRDLSDDADADAERLWDAMTCNLSDDHAEDLAFGLMKENYRDNDD